MQATGRVYGFDGRVRLDGSAPDWPPERRAAYLLRPEIKRPVSVDRAVWPPVEPALTPSGAAADYWSNLTDLRAACRTAGLVPDACSIVALSALASDVDLSRVLELLSPPLEPRSHWHSLGYDVADSGLLSALSNAGFVPGIDDITTLRMRWAPLLNDHGLFSAARDADAFRAFSDLRVSEHAPFFVHEIHSVAEALAG